MKIPSRIRTALVATICCAAFCHVAQAGYDLHITRAKEWTDSKKTPVPVEDWTQFVKSDSEFRIVQTKDAKDKPKDAIWVDPKDKREVYFYYSDGEITVKDPDERIIAEMKKVAVKLKAKVVGDDGEDYK
jgi:hypothetical protein